MPVENLNEPKLNAAQIQSVAPVRGLARDTSGCYWRTPEEEYDDFWSAERARVQGEEEQGLGQTSNSAASSTSGVRHSFEGGETRPFSQGKDGPVEEDERERSV